MHSNGDWPSECPDGYIQHLATDKMVCFHLTLLLFIYILYAAYTGAPELHRIKISFRKNGYSIRRLYENYPIFFLEKQIMHCWCLQWGGVRTVMC